MLGRAQRLVHRLDCLDGALFLLRTVSLQELRHTLVIAKRVRKKIQGQLCILAMVALNGCLDGFEYVFGGRPGRFGRRDIGELLFETLQLKQMQLTVRTRFLQILPTTVLRVTWRGRSSARPPGIEARMWRCAPEGS